MKKETIIASSAGILAGVLIAVFLILRSQEGKSAGNTLIPSVSPTIAIAEEKVESYQVIEPKDTHVTDTDEITIKGKAPIGSTVVAQSAVGEVVEKVEKDTFELDFPLGIGENVILVNFYHKKDHEQQLLHVYFIENE